MAARPSPLPGGPLVIEVHGSLGNHRPGGRKLERGLVAPSQEVVDLEGLAGVGHDSETGGHLLPLLLGLEAEGEVGPGIPGVEHAYILVETVSGVALREVPFVGGGGGSRHHVAPAPGTPVGEVDGAFGHDGLGGIHPGRYLPVRSHHRVDVHRHPGLGRHQDVLYLGPSIRKHVGYPGCGVLPPGIEEGEVFLVVVPGVALGEVEGLYAHLEAAGESGRLAVGVLHAYVPGTRRRAGEVEVAGYPGGGDDADVGGVDVRLSRFTQLDGRIRGAVAVVHGEEAGARQVAYTRYAVVCPARGVYSGYGGGLPGQPLCVSLPGHTRTVVAPGDDGSTRAVMGQLGPLSLVGQAVVPHLHTVYVPQEAAVRVHALYVGVILSAARVTPGHYGAAGAVGGHDRGPCLASRVLTQDNAVRGPLGVSAGVDPLDVDIARPVPLIRPGYHGPAAAVGDYLGQKSALRDKVAHGHTARGPLNTTAVVYLLGEDIE